MSSKRLVLESAPFQLVVDANLGGHIVEYNLHGQNCMISGRPEIGSTFWPSPQSAWGWPPPNALDKGSYEIKDIADGILIKSSVCEQTHLCVEKEFHLYPDHLSVAYTLHNCGDKPVQYAPWEITRMGGGLTFYASDQAILPLSTGKVEMEKGVIWHDYHPEQQTHHEKIFGNGSSGWVANAYNQLLLVKKFIPVPSEWVAPGEGEVEIYAHSDLNNRYIEMEQQGRYQHIPPTGSVRWQVMWYLSQWDDKKFPPNSNRVRLVEKVKEVIGN
jgi:hypothetical protein